VVAISPPPAPWQAAGRYRNTLSAFPGDGRPCRSETIHPSPPLVGIYRRDLAKSARAYGPGGWRAGISPPWA